MPAPADFDVAVIGLGPVGSIAALLLAREGLKVVAIEPSLTIFDKPRAIGLDHESLRTLQKVCPAAEIEALLGPYRASEYRSKSGAVLRRVIPQPPPYPLAWPPSATFVQPDLEALLGAMIARAPGIEACRGSKVVGVRQDADHACLDVTGPGAGQTRTITARYAIACDGSASPTRQALGLSLEDLDFDEPWLVVDVRVGPKAKLPDHVIQLCDPDRPTTFVPGPGSLRRWEFMLLPGEDPARMMREDAVWALLSPWVTPADATIWRAAAYRFHALVCRHWRQGPYFLAGDAAHQTPPFMAQGLNQGIKDAANLSWKIAEVVRHGAHPALLDTYDAERRPNARAVIDLTKQFGRLICERDTEAAAARDARLLADMAAGKGEFVRQDLLPPLERGFLDARKEEIAASGIGRTFPQPWIETENGRHRCDDALRARFLLVADPAWQPSVAAIACARQLQIRLVSWATPASTHVAALRDDAGLIKGWLDRYGASCALVRPDHVVFATSARAAGEEDLIAKLQRALAQGFAAYSASE